MVCLVVSGCRTPTHDASDVLQVRLQAAIDRLLDTRDIPGMSVAVITNGHLVRAVGGLADVEAHREVVVDDEFRLASITKTYVAALAVDRSKAGLIGLDDTVGRWLPDLPESLARLREATLRELLSHTSGLAQTFTADRDRGRVLSVDDALARIPPSVCDPGQCWNYADGNYVVAGLMLEAATGMPLSAAVDEQFLDPLDLRHTRFVGDRVAVSVPQYALVPDATGAVVTRHRLRRQLLPIRADDAAGGMRASASDLARWGDLLFRDRASRPGVVERMLDTSTTRGLPCPNRCPYPYGLGVFHYSVDGRQLVGHDGSSGAILAHDTRRATTIAVVTNGGERDNRALLAAVLHAIDGRD